ncbi:MAG: class I SAM-dependent methyltransferase [Zhengella sp.]|uniref:class I SAM-dependent methyltransferase n=1 Tax=Zhengella sp. TaxID=2282762 RepID=UPI001DA7B0F2|nr:class I SAM-dependent methyltransferase [Notoacmeibacter sp.]MCC0025632.1 class I SAM-dependent methyltransferase [Brucellaceae bacterium]
MNDDRLKILFHPFATGLVATPGSGRWIAAGIGAGLVLPDGFGADLTLLQGFRPDHDALARAGFTVQPDWPEAGGARFDGALVLLGRHRGQNEEWLRQALVRLKPGACVIVAGGKTEGAQSFAKRLKAALPGAVESVSKHHGLAMWFRRPDDATVSLEFAAPPAPPLVEGRFRTAPGMFSHDRVDAGSRLLAGHLPAALAGRVADFCAGWGYLAAEVAMHCPRVTALDLYEADHDALEAARGNLAWLAVPVAFHWHDLAAGKVERGYDAVVMNPPFHTGRRAEPDLGRAMIRRAAEALRPGGSLLMVANRQLPYEEVLSASFGKLETRAVEGGFKVLFARR